MNLVFDEILRARGNPRAALATVIATEDGTAKEGAKMLVVRHDTHGSGDHRRLCRRPGD
jgi:xanthine/CO dehydrogenase XdhC/CoxF family maturation factor